MLEYCIKKKLSVSLFKKKKSGNQNIVFCLSTINWWISTQLTKANFRFALLLPFQIPMELKKKKKTTQWLISALPKCPYSANVIFGLGHMLSAISRKLSPPRLWKPGFAESIQAPSHLHVYQGSFTAQRPQQGLANGRIVLQNHPKSGLAASFSPGHWNTC